uniref:Uncharacterized protein n=1 Tax=Cyprinus carpio TaxID=7962 RepID=A0A8C1M3E5_CYPCA
MRQSFVRCTLALSSRAETMLHCWTSRLVWKPLNSSDPPASASQQLGLQARATAPGESCEHQR